MNLSGMKRGDYVSPKIEIIDEEPIVKSCDQFQASEIFWVHGKLLKDTEVISRVADSPELAEKVRSMITERDTSSFSTEMKDSDLFTQLKEQFVSKQDALDFIDNRIAEIQEQEKSTANKENE